MLTPNLLFAVVAIVVCYFVSVWFYGWLAGNMPTKGISSPRLKTLADSAIVAGASTVFFTVPMLFIGISLWASLIWFASFTAIFYFAGGPRLRK